jgi:hypothetical protein
MRVLAILLLAAMLGGCNSQHGQPRTSLEETMFGPAAMRIHPIFTRFKDWSGDGNIDGIEALVEFQDEFGDPTKATGKVIFELFEYRPDEPDTKGDRLLNPWIGSLSDEAEQRERWNRTSRSYSFQLACNGVSTSRTYVLAATFELPSGWRFFDRVILEPQKQEPKRAQPTTLPNFAPGARSPEP